MFTRRTTLGLFAASPVLAMLPTATLAAEPPVYSRRGVAIRGADPVAYWDGNGPVDGLRSITGEWNGATWRFATEANRDAFLADPERFAPEYGGYCAYAMARGQIARTIPEAWSIVDNRLFLNFNLDIRAQWETELPDAIGLADANWPSALG